MEAIQNKLVEYLRNRFGNSNMDGFIFDTDQVEEQEALKELIKEEKRTTKKQLHDLPVIFRNIISKISEIRDQTPSPRAELFANIVFQELPKDVSNHYKNILARSMVTPETPKMHFEQYFREPTAPHSEEEPNTNLLYELEQIPYCKDIGKAHDLLSFLDFLDEQFPAIDPNIKYLFIDLKGYITRITPEEFQNVIKHGRLSPDAPKGVFQRKYKEAYIFARSLKMTDKDFNSSFVIEGGNPLHGKHWKPEKDKKENYKITAILEKHGFLWK